jgi:hypothetical protein
MKPGATITVTVDQISRMSPHQVTQTLAGARARLYAVRPPEKALADSEKDRLRKIIAACETRRRALNEPEFVKLRAREAKIGLGLEPDAKKLAAQAKARRILGRD